MAKKLSLIASEDFESIINELPKEFSNDEHLHVVKKQSVTQSSYDAADPQIYEALFNFGISVAGSLAANCLYGAIKKYILKTNKHVKIHNGVKRIKIDPESIVNDRIKDKFFKDMGLLDVL